MFKKKFQAYEEAMAQLDNEQFAKAVQLNEYKMQAKAKKPIYGGLTGVLVSGALFALTGIFAGWTVGALWVAGTLMGATALGSAITAFIARRKYAKYNKTMATFKKLMAMNDKGIGYDASQYAALESKLSKQLGWLYRKRMISARELGYYQNAVNINPCCTSKSDFKANRREKEIEKANQMAKVLFEDIQSKINQYEKFSDKFEHNPNGEWKADKVELVIANPQRRIENGREEFLKNSEGDKTYPNEVAIEVKDELSLHIALKAIEKSLAESYKSGDLHLPIKLYGLKDGQSFDVLSNGETIIDDEDKLAKAIEEMQQVNKNFFETARKEQHQEEKGKENGAETLDEEKVKPEQQERAMA